MKHKLLKISILAISFVLVMSLLLGCAGCKIFKDEELRENGFFQYILVGEDGPFPRTQEKNVVAIVGFTRQGKLQEVIDFPEEIDGKPVRFISFRYYSSFMDRYYQLESAHLKKIYVHENIKTVYRDAFSNFDDKELDIMVCAAKPYHQIFGNYYGNFYIYNSLFTSELPENVHGANIVFINNYSDEVNGGYYRLDNISEGEKISVPPIPQRNGYEFTGWYTEAECVNVWDFDWSPTMEGVTEFRLYAGWQAL